MTSFKKIVMKKITLLLLAVVLISTSFSSCRDDEPKKTKLEYSINGVDSKSIAYAYRYDDYEENQLKRYVYVIQSLKSGIIYLESSDSTFDKSTFIFPEFKFSYSNISGNEPIHYNAISGRLTFLENNGEEIIGEFGGILVNQKDSKDTLKIDNGIFEISLQTFKRTF